jgi:hypothetical protein
MLELMFETAVTPDRQRILAELRHKISPEPDHQVLAVPAPLAEILPRRGLPRGGVVSLCGSSGSVSLLLTLLAAPVNAWSALVGMPDVGLLAAAELGVDLDRIVLIPDPGPDVLQVLSVLADGVDLIAVGPPPGSTFGATPARLRVLAARLRQSGAVLLVHGQWPGAELVLESRVQGWSGLDRGHGRLRDRELIVEVRGRGAAGRGRSAAMLLKSNRSRVQIAAGPDSPGQGQLGQGQLGQVQELLAAHVG